LGFWNIGIINVIMIDIARPFQVMFNPFNPTKWIKMAEISGRPLKKKHTH
jgi:hypothetical protein